MINRKIFFIISCLFIFADILAFELNNIKIIGLHRVDDALVYSVLPVNIGDDVTKLDYPIIIKKIYGTGEFENIKLLRTGNTLVIKLVERPVINKILIKGNEDVNTKKLLSGLKNIGISSGRTFKDFIIKSVSNELKQMYHNQGKYSVKITTNIKKLSRNRVDVVINIQEGDVAKIKKIVFIGNGYFSNKKLLNIIGLQTYGRLSFVTKRGYYSKYTLDNDIEKLKSFYIDNGFINFKIVDTKVSLSKNKKFLYIKIKLQEGERYRISSMKLSGNIAALNYPQNKLISVKKGDIYSYKKITDIKTRILDLLSSSGYSFADVKIIKNLNNRNHTVAIDLFIKPGNKVYVRHINFYGNKRTQDLVLRRVMLQLDGAYFSKEKLEESKRRLNQLGYIKNININTVPVSGTNDQVDINVTLEEANAGQFSGGMGYSQAEGLLFNLSVSQSNFFGTGRQVSLSMNRSSAVTSLGFSYADPYLTLDGIGFGINTYYNKTKANKMDITDYTSDSKGIDFSLYLPVSLYDIFTFTAGYQNKSLKKSANLSEKISNYLVTEGYNYNLYNTAVIWSRSTLDRYLFPTRGMSHSAKFNIILPFSDLKYYTLENLTRLYYPLYNDFIFMTKFFIGYGNGYGTGKLRNLPFFENYYAGGPGSVRGFQENSLGPLDSNGSPIGGNFSVNASIEIFVPVPMTHSFIDNFFNKENIRPSLFFDIGNVFNNKLKLNTLRKSIGIAMQWISPMGPVAISIAKPIEHQPFDSLKSFQFNMGTTY